LYSTDAKSVNTLTTNVAAQTVAVASSSTLFTNAASNIYTLVSTNTTAINKGTTTGAPSDDILSATRTGYPDIGCYESQDCSVVPASSFVASSITSSSMTVTWTRGGGTGVLVVARPTSAGATDPTNGSTYTANAAYSSGQL